ncbi:hypothetical protein O9993_19720 [Vibrio lentus]|nr:hypothetical protein [Vibrio lentus]
MRIIHDKVLESGGLHIIGTEQRQVNLAVSITSYVVVIVKVMRVLLVSTYQWKTSSYVSFTSDRMAGLIQSGMDEGEGLNLRCCLAQLKAQRKVEGRNLTSVSSFLEYDDEPMTNVRLFMSYVMN